MRIHEYALMKDVTATLVRPRQPDSMWRAPPLVVMNNFASRPELKLATALFQNLFPAINVQTAKLSTCQVSLRLDITGPSPLQEDTCVICCHTCAESESLLGACSE
jgi:ribosome biogenesis protein SSF1/2